MQQVNNQIVLTCLHLLSEDALRLLVTHGNMWESGVNNNEQTLLSCDVDKAAAYPLSSRLLLNISEDTKEKRDRLQIFNLDFL